MADTTTAAYTGCLVAVNNGGEVVLTHVEEETVMAAGTLSHGMSDTMPNRRDTLALTSLKVVAPSCS